MAIFKSASVGKFAKNFEFEDLLIVAFHSRQVVDTQCDLAERLCRRPACRVAYFLMCLTILSNHFPVWLLRDTYVVQRPIPGTSGLLGALHYGATFAHFTCSTLYALTAHLPNYEATEESGAKARVIAMIV